MLDLAKALQDMLQQALQDGAEAYIGSPGSPGIVDRHFTTGNEARYGWKPLTPDYARQKREQYGQRPILVASGRLRQSMRHGTADINNNNFSMTIKFNNAVNYAKYHDAGSPTLPRRSPVELNVTDIKALRDAMQRSVDNAIRRLNSRK